MSDSERTAGITVLAIAILAILVGVGACVAFQRVEPGYAAVIIDYSQGQTVGGNVRGTKVPPGQWVFINPITQRLASYSIANQTLTMVRRVEEGKVKGDDSVKVVDVNGVTLNMDVSIVYRVNPEEVGELYNDWAGAALVGADDKDIEDRLVRPAVRSTLPNTVKGRTYLQIYSTEREKIQAEAEKTLKEYLGTKHIIVEAFQVREVYLPEALVSAIHQKTAEQQEAQKAAATADKNKALAEAEVNKAEGDKRASIIRAEGQAQSITLINEALFKSPLYLQYQTIQRWNGELPRYMGSGVVPFLSLPVPEEKER